MDEIRIERDLDLPRGIVWEALVDPELVGGWLHPSERLVTGTSPVEFREPDDPAEPAVLEVISPSFGDVRVVLIRNEGGTRGEATRVELTVSDEWGRRSERVALWELRLDQLEALLRGRPVDWGRWPAQHRAADAEARAEAALRAVR
ncbi:MAG: SRPBCC family protein [Protaetiibacter sp.]